MANPLIERALPAELAERGHVVDYTGELREFERLAAVVAGELERVPAAERRTDWQRTPVRAALAFGWLDGKHRVPAVSGQVDARLTAVCQRCLEPFELAIEAPLNLLFQTPGDATLSPVPGDRDVWESEEERIRPIDLVEETVIMALPLAPVHESAEDCGPLAAELDAGRSEVVRPFADLRAQMDETGD